MDDILKIILSALFSFLLLFVVAKILGKKQIVELDFIDYVVGISLGSISAQWATDTDKPWYHYFIAIIIFALLSLLITLLSRTTPLFKRFLQGSPIVIINNGKLVYKNIKKSKLSLNDVLGMCRDKNFFNIEEIAFAILETSGNLSILPQTQYRAIQLEDLTKPNYTSSDLPVHVIIDGRVFDKQLADMQKDKAWLFDKLNINSSRQLKNIFLASYNSQSDSFELHLKDQPSDIPPLK